MSIPSFRVEMSISSFARKGAKVAVLPVGAWTRRRAGDFVALLYHRVGVGEREIDIPSTTFDAQVAALVDRDRIISLDQALEGETAGVVITFDDGFRDFSDHVVPCLSKYRVPAVLYLATGLVANGEHRPSEESMTWSQLDEAVSTGLVTVGSHTHDHVDLSRADEATAEEQMRRSKEL